MTKYFFFNLPVLGGYTPQWIADGSNWKAYLCRAGEISLQQNDPQTAWRMMWTIISGYTHLHTVNNFYFERFFKKCAFNMQ